VSAQGQYAGQYFGDYFGQAGTPVVPGVMVGTAHISFSAVGELTAVYPVVPGVMVGTAHISFSATGLLTDGQAPAVSDAEDFSPHGRIRRGRHAADFQPDWLLEALNPPKPPRRARKRREEDLVMLA
jgi:hypothetical protein